MDSPGGLDIKDIDAALQQLWERARRLSDVVAGLRDENKGLRTNLAEAEEARQKLSEAVRDKEGELASLKTELRKLQQNGTSFLNREEKETFREKIKELISKIESRL